MGVGIQHTTTSGTFSLDGETFEVDNNVWVVGDERDCVVIDAPHDVAAIRRVIGDRTVSAVLATHAHDDHVRFAPELADAVGAPIYLHPDDRVLWDMTHPRRRPDHELSDGQFIDVAGIAMEVLHTPGHAPGAVCFHSPDLGVVFTGDTLFSGGPGATGRSHSDFGVIMSSIQSRLLVLPEDTIIHPGHGDSSTVGAVAPHFEEWKMRGH